LQTSNSKEPVVAEVAPFASYLGKTWECIWGGGHVYDCGGHDCGWRCHIDMNRTVVIVRRCATFSVQLTVLETQLSS